MSSNSHTSIETTHLGFERVDWMPQAPPPLFYSLLSVSLIAHHVANQSGSPEKHPQVLPFVASPAHTQVVSHIRGTDQTRLRRRLMCRRVTET